MEVATDEANTPIKQDTKKGKLRDYPYNINWNYGCLPQTWEARIFLPERAPSLSPGVPHAVFIFSANCSRITPGLSRWPPLQDPGHENKELGVKGDNDPVDVVEIGSAACPFGSVTPVRRPTGHPVCRPFAT